MIIRFKDGFISIGKAVGHVLEDFLVSAKKRLWVISPWVSPKYAELLLKKKEEGVDIKLITTNDYGNKQHRDSLVKLIGKEYKPLLKNSRRFLIVSLILFVISLIFFAIEAGLGAFIMTLSIIGLILSLLKSSKFVSNIPLIAYDKRSDFTHSKIYVTEKMGAVGSANFTESGFWRNIEVIAIIRKEGIIRNLVDLFNQIEENPIMEKVELKELGKNLFAKEKRGVKIAKKLTKKSI